MTMTRRVAWGLALTLWMAGAGTEARAQQTPSTVNYQGRFVDGTNLVQGAHVVRFRVYASAAATHILYYETNAVTVVDGFYSTRLGANPSAVGSLLVGPPPQPLYGTLVALLNCGSNLYLEVALDGTAMSPRERILAVPYAMVAGKAEAVSDGAITADSLASGLRNTLSSPNGSVTNAVYVDSNGLVGVGTTNPAAGVDIRSGSAVLTPVVLSETVDGDGSFTNLSAATAVCVSLPYAYVAAYSDDAVTIMDVSDPATPVFVNCIRDGVGDFDDLDGVISMAEKDGYLFVGAYYDSAVSVICVTNPLSPRLVTRLVDSYSPYDYLAGVRKVAVSGNYLYVFTSTDAAMTIVDISNPEAPAFQSVVYDGLGAFTNMSNLQGGAVEGSLACAVSSGEDAVTLIDVSNPASPQFLACVRDEVDGFSKLEHAYDAAFVGEYLYITASWEDALTIMDVSTPSSPVLVNEIGDGEEGIHGLDNVIRLHSSGQRLVFSSSTDDSVSILDVSSPSEPRMEAFIKNGLGGFNYITTTEGFALVGSLLFLVDESDDALTICSLSSTNSTGDAGLVVKDRVGIGTAAPRAALEVAGDTLLDGDLTLLGDFYWNKYVNSTGILKMNSDGRVYLDTEDNGIYVSYPACAFRPVTGSVTNYHVDTYLYLDSGSGELRVHVNAPDGANLGYLKIRYMDNDASHNMQVQLIRQEVDSAVTTTMASWTSSSSSGAITTYTTTAISDDTIDNGSYTYYFSLTPASGHSWSSSLRLYSISLSHNISY